MKTTTDKEGELLSWIEGLSNTTLGKVTAVLNMVLYRAEVKDTGSCAQGVLNIGSEDFVNIQSNKNEVTDVLKRIGTFFEIDILNNRSKYTLVGDIFGKPENKDIPININLDILKILSLSIEKIQSIKNKRNKKNSEERPLFFDVDKSRFYVQGREIKLSKFKDEYHTLRVMFEDPDELPKEWFFSEIREKIDGGALDDKKYYNAIHQLRIKLERQGINDFFITNIQSVKINNKYLS
ncbi:MAG: hypothetical protein AAB497_02810 [Patescibacteria group bacterium]